MKQIINYFQNIFKAIFCPWAIEARRVVIFELDDTGSPQSPQSPEYNPEKITMAKFIALYWEKVQDYSDRNRKERIENGQADWTSLQKIIDMFSGEAYARNLNQPLSFYLTKVAEMNTLEDRIKLYNLSFLAFDLLEELLAELPGELRILFMNAFELYDPNAPETPLTPVDTENDTADTSNENFC
ncbi:hypothetical protein H6771_01010 [Candidatus Peribacteria bacterium]|nr:hypothetical protein [Candidatus Peribacteria bacterium]